jgi:hypothetical protein
MPGGRIFEAGRNVCAECLPKIEDALTGWLTMTLGCHDDTTRWADQKRRIPRS